LHQKYPQEQHSKASALLALVGKYIHRSRRSTETMLAEEGAISDVLTNLAKPKSSATLTLRIIKSFEYRTEKSLVLHDVNLEATTVGRLKEIAKQSP